MGDAQVGPQARLMSQALRKLTGSISKSNHGDLHQPDPDEDRRDVRQPRDHHRRQRAEVLRLRRLDIRRIGAIKDRDEVVGNQTRVKVVKNKVAPPFQQVEFDILYGEGISKRGELIDLGVKAGASSRSPAPGTPTGQRHRPGQENAKVFLKDNPDIASRSRTRSAPPTASTSPCPTRRPPRSSTTNPGVGSPARPGIRPAGFSPPYSIFLPKVLPPEAPARSAGSATRASVPALPG